MNIAYKRNNRCQICYNLIEKGYHIHHLTYENIGNEKDEDLLFLCEKCHDEIHNGKITRYKTGEDLTEKVKKGPKYPQVFIKSDAYRNKTSENKIKYLLKCFDNNAVFTVQDKISIIKYIEDVIIDKYNTKNKN
jgi:hypothetical protein